MGLMTPPSQRKKIAKIMYEEKMKDTWTPALINESVFQLIQILFWFFAVLLTMTLFASLLLFMLGIDPKIRISIFVQLTLLAVTIALLFLYLCSRGAYKELDKLMSPRDLFKKDKL